MAQQQRPAKVLIFSKTAGFRHDSIPDAIDALKGLGPASNVSFDATEDAAKFTDENLQAYDGLLFLMNTGAVLGDDGVGALQRYLDAGGNFIGVHSASDSLTNITFFGREIGKPRISLYSFLLLIPCAGAYFDYHPELQNATVLVLDKTHPSTEMLPDRWPVHDEIYNFKSDPRSIGAKVLLSVDASSYVDDGTRKFDQGTPHPLAWYQEKGAGVDSSAKRVGRSWYTSLGHDVATWKNDLYLSHVMGGVTWALASGTTRAFDDSASVGNGGSSST
ncbi:class I glutamine amidotransferase-like protein [Exidia glandulosa HHB12029]|uniref:Class I glutamine amidotransferase-like protein n=1 Tax=Exidia glandulosa HHB12029 TaxID=1314781 RepID=A0A165PW49_EXIGL|nr:class I glutamine amidotransferase-like protein [Exidia glandulosa HHB12029]